MHYINRMSLRKSKIILAVFINIIVFATAMLLFGSTPKTDDFDMAKILYGGITGEYSGIILYINPILGYFMKFLLQIWPTISWYYVLQYILMFVAFSSLTYVLLKKFHIKQALLYWSVLMCFSAYEFYVRITFSKTCGVLLVVGLLLILYAIDNRAKAAMYLLGGGLASIGILYRNTMLLLVLCIFFSSFIFSIVLNKNNVQKLKVIVLKFVLISVGLYMFSIGTDCIKDYIYENDTVWEGYQESNATRAGLTDLGWPDYETYSQEYSELGVSENDYKMWKELNNIGDPERFDEELIKSISDIDREDENSLLDTLLNASKNLTQYYVENPMFWCLLIFVCLFLLAKREYKGMIIVTILGFCIFSYYYMSARGRVQHHVDVVVCLAAIVLLIYYSGDINDESQYALKCQAGLAILLTIGAVNYFYTDISAQSYYGQGVDMSSEELEKNYEKLKLFAEDKNHFYVLDSTEIYRICQGFDTFSVIEKGIYHNVFLVNQYAIPPYQQALKDYGIQNPIAELVNSNMLYFCALENSSYRMNIILKYIQENYYPDAYYTLVKIVDGTYVYRFNAGELDVQGATILQNSDKVEHEIEVSLNESNFVDIRGHAFVEGEDSYAQTIYIEVEDCESEESEFYYTVQEENKKYYKADKFHGKYSSFSTTIQLENIDKVKLYLIIENNQGIYRLPIESS